MPKDIKLYNTR